MIKIEISGTGEEARNEMVKLLGLYQSTAQAESPIREEIKKEPETQPVQDKVRRARRRRKLALSEPISWTAQEVEKLLNEVNPNAKKILAELAKKPEGYQRSEMIKVLDLKERAVGGQLSSLGSALRRTGRKTSPVSHEKIDGELVYKLEKDFAAIMNQQNI